MKKILIVEDDETLVKMWGRMFAGKLIIVTAGSIEDAHQMYKSHHDISVIVVDGLVPADNTSFNPDALTLDLIKKLRETFKGTMIATSSYENVRQQQMESGCDYECDKKQLKNMLKKLSII